MKFIAVVKTSLFVVALATVSLCATPLLAVDFEGVYPAAFTLPEVNGSVQPTSGGNPYHLDFGLGLTVINTEPAYLDTGTSGIVISDFVAENYTRGAAKIPRDPGVKFFDIALGGTVSFDVSMPVNVRIASSAATNADSLSQYPTVYNQVTGPVRLQISEPSGGGIFDLSPNVYGMPVMMGKTVVIDPTLDEVNLVFQQTTIYNQNDPAIPTTSHHVRLSYGDFSRFTHAEGGEGPTLAHNPLIGPNPLRLFDENPPPDDTPPVAMSYRGQRATGTMLFDTGAVASFLSAGLAGTLGVRYSGEIGPTGDPLLERFNDTTQQWEDVPEEDQFTLPIAGISGEGSTLAGFYLDTLVLHTIEGSLDDGDPNNIRYVRAPMLVLQEDIELTEGDQTVVLDGIFGMNFLLASGSIDGLNGSVSPYRWVTFDEPTGILGLDLAFVPEPSTYAMAAFALMAFGGYAWRRRATLQRARQALS